MALQEDTWERTVDSHERQKREIALYTGPDLTKLNALSVTTMRGYEILTRTVIEPGVTLKSSAMNVNILLVHHSVH